MLYSTESMLGDVLERKLKYSNNVSWGLKANDLRLSPADFETESKEKMGFSRNLRRNK